MTLKCGIIGLPNVGKSTLFNALIESNNAEVANYPFCTIAPNIGTVSVPDKRLEQLAYKANSKKMIPAFVEFADIAGLVKGASKGEGLGNQFLSHIREVDAVVHVLRCFTDTSVTHIYGKIDPIEDAKLIETELIISDLDQVEKRITKLLKKVHLDQTMERQINLLKKCREALSNGHPVRTLKQEIDNKDLQGLNLLTSKPILFICNVSEDDLLTGNKFSRAVSIMAKQQGAISITISSKIEAELSLLEDKKEKQEFLKSFNLNNGSLIEVIQSAYSLLNLNSFFTVGPKESRAWTFSRGLVASEAAGIIHNDFKRGFIKAEVIKYNDLLELGNELKAKEVGKVRVEGKDYIMQDGDVVHFRFNV